MKYFFIFLILLSSYIIAQGYQKEISDLYVSGKLDEAITKAKEILLNDPFNPEVSLLIGRSYIDKGRFLDGESFLIQVSNNNRCPSWMKAWALHYLGRVEFLKNNKHKSKEYFNECLNLNATKNATKSSVVLLKILALDDSYSNFEISESENIKFYFQQNSVITNKKQFIEAREKAFTYLKEYFNVEIPKKIDFVIWNSNEDAKKTGINQLGFANPEFCVIHSRYNQTIGHEISHVITYFLTEKPIRTRFLNEGVAVCFDQSNNNRFQIINDQRLNDSLQIVVSIKEAWNNPEAYPEWVYYQLAGEFVNRLLENLGKEKLLELLKNQTYENALLIYGEELIKIISDLENEIN